MCHLQVFNVDIVVGVLPSPLGHLHLAPNVLIVQELSPHPHPDPHDCCGGHLGVGSHFTSTNGQPAFSFVGRPGSGQQNAFFRVILKEAWDMGH